MQLMCPHSPASTTSETFLLFWAIIQLGRLRALLLDNVFVSDVVTSSDRAALRGAAEVGSVGRDEKNVNSNKSFTNGILKFVNTCTITTRWWRHHATTTKTQALIQCSGHVTCTCGRWYLWPHPGCYIMMLSSGAVIYCFYNRVFARPHALSFETDWKEVGDREKIIFPPPTD